jgi:hypothetical protein
MKNNGIQNTLAVESTGIFIEVRNEEKTLE